MKLSNLGIRMKPRNSSVHMEILIMDVPIPIPIVSTQGLDPVFERIDWIVIDTRKEGILPFTRNK
jgi:hypothetical protein